MYGRTNGHGFSNRFWWVGAIVRRSKSATTCFLEKKARFLSLVWNWPNHFWCYLGYAAGVSAYTWAATGGEFCTIQSRLIEPHHCHLMDDNRSRSSSFIVHTWDSFIPGWTRTTPKEPAVNIDFTRTVSSHNLDDFSIAIQFFLKQN